MTEVFPSIFQFSNIAQLFWAFVGAVISTILTIAFSIFQQRNNKNIFGQWHSKYQDIEGSHGTWSDENVKISRRFGKIKIKNHDCSLGYNYTATASSIEDGCLSGSWVSNRPEATAKGIFMLCANPQGTIFYGYWVGPDGTHAKRYCKWILAKEEGDIIKAKNLLDSMTRARSSNEKLAKIAPSAIPQIL